MIYVPSAFNNEAPNIGCKSVETPGNGRVEISIGESCFGDSTSMKSLPTLNFPPISVYFLISIGRWSGLIPTTLPFPFVERNAPI